MLVSSSSDIAQELLDVAMDWLSEFHVQSGIVDKSWILFDSGASANSCPNWFAEDHPLLPGVGGGEQGSWGEAVSGELMA